MAQSEAPTSTISGPHVGVVLPSREALRSGRPELVPSFARAAEERGFQSLWAGDSLLARPVYDPFTVLACAAATTTTALLGTGVLLAPMRSPALTAQAIGSLDQLSGGRLILGLGRGFDLPETRRDFAAAGAGFEQRTRRLVETISFWRSLWAPGGRASLDRPYGRLDDEAILPPVARPGGPPIWLAGYGEASFERTGRLADGWLPYPPEPEDYASGWESVRRAAEDAGRDPGAITPAVMATVHVGDRASSQLALEQYVTEFYGYPLALVSSIQACRAGEGDDIVAYLRAFWDAGARVFVLRAASLDAPERQLDALADTVLPAVSSWRDPAGAPSVDRVGPASSTQHPGTSPSISAARSLSSSPPTS
jgi:alkanesulfonate monooxygenase SsuD/methylene tetrahydromethanopterin reductase-like flavin-dependent oxidoreductase (luciferase family)